MRQRQVVTIHGINTDGEWQEMAKCVFGPHFECLNLKYPHYRRFGALKLLVHLPSLLVGLTTCLVPWMILSWVGINTDKWIWALLGGTVLAVSHGIAHSHRRRAVDYIDRELSRKMGTRPPDFIGHSLGTYLCGTLLLRAEYRRFNRMILAGCVLPTKYPWKQLNASGRKACREVQNEVGKRDLVVWIAFALHGWVGQFGQAGYRGFRAKDGTVHNLKGPYDACRYCDGETAALVHNIDHPEVGHSDLFITPEYCDSFWFPFLLEIHPSEYREFSDLCIEAANLEIDDPKHELPLLIAVFFEERWEWADGTVADALRKELRKLVGNKMNTSNVESIVDTIL